MDKETWGQIVFGICVALGPVAMGMRAPQVKYRRESWEQGWGRLSPCLDSTGSPLLPCGRQRKRTGGLHNQRKTSQGTGVASHTDLGLTHPLC